ncbi:ankyrin repeat-containing protein [Anaeramoeba flamelloides]|uniref:Ankyrin repeat-containing protein n=1 Tax=Anaeramoeba flamelloides TaxID=1746091 RepID=A0ABQ8XIT0_9EUKA|nr:ankyrin repeat-containing protein [Anaeramoeba flamelloides]
MNIWNEIENTNRPKSDEYKEHVNKKKNGMSPFLYACLKNRLNWIESILFHTGNYSDYTERTRSSGLHLCMNEEVSLNVVIFLISNTNDQNWKNKEGVTPFHLCCKNCAKANVFYRLLPTANLEIEDIEGYNAYCYAIENRESGLEFLKALFEQENYHGKRNLIYHCLKTNPDQEILKYLFRILPKSQHNFCEFTIEDDLSMIKYSTVLSNESILFYALEQRLKLKVLAILLQNGINYHIKCFNGTILHYLVFYEYPLKYVKVILDNTKLTIDIQNSHKDTPLMISIKSKPNYNYIRELLSLGASPNVGNTSGNTALHLAFLNNCPLPIIMLLLVKGADVRIQNRRSQTPLDMIENKFLLQHSSIVFDFLSLREKESFSDSKIVSKDGHTISTHSHFLIFRIPIALEKAIECLQNYTKVEIDSFLRWVYSGIIETQKQRSTVLTIYTDLTKTKPILKNSFYNFMDDLNKMYLNDESKDCVLLVKNKNFDPETKKITKSELKKPNEIKDNIVSNQVGMETTKEEMVEVSKIKQEQEQEQKEEETEEKQEETEEKKGEEQEQEQKVKIKNREKYTRIPVHSSILSSRSNLFRGMFLFCNFEKEIKDFSGFLPQTIQILIRYFYTNNLPQKNLPTHIINELYEAIEYYQLSVSSNLGKLLNNKKKKHTRKNTNKKRGKKRRKGKGKRKEGRKMERKQSNNNYLLYMTNNLNKK